VSLLVWLAALPCLFWTQGAESAPALKTAGIERVCVAADQASGWGKSGLSVVAITESDLALREALAVPGIRQRADRASATRSPWVNANGWRFLRTPGGTFVYDLPAGAAALAAAEAYAYGADAVLKIEPADLESLGRMLAFLAKLPAPASPLPEVTDFAVVDDGTATVGELLNLLVRRNLLFRIVPSEAAQYRLNVRLGSAAYPQTAGADPSALALKVRRALGDDARSLRIFGSEVVIGRLTAEGARARLHLVNYGGRDLEGLRVRVRGTWPAGSAEVAGLGRVALEEQATIEGGTEFTVPRLGPYAVVDLPAVP